MTLHGGLTMDLDHAGGEVRGGENEEGGCGEGGQEWFHGAVLR